MTRTRKGQKTGTLSALVEARKAREEAQEREAQLCRLAAEEIGLSLLEADDGEVDPATLVEIVQAIVRLGSRAAITRLNAEVTG